MKSRIILASAALLGLAACGGGDEADNKAMDNMSMPANDMAMNDMMPADGAMARNGQEYAMMAAASDMYEIESAKLAMEKSENEEIDALAEMIITDHEKSTADLKTAAGEAEPAITVMPEMNAEQQSMMQALRSANGAQFDQTYLEQQVTAHEKALAMVRDYAANGEVPALQQHASTVAGPIQQHLDKARELQQQQMQ